jgi:hypothetical protein
MKEKETKQAMRKSKRFAAYPCKYRFIATHLLFLPKLKGGVYGKIIFFF